MRLENFFIAYYCIESFSISLISIFNGIFQSSDFPTSRIPISQTFLESEWSVTQVLIRPALIQKPSENSRIQLFKIGEPISIGSQDSLLESITSRISS